MMKKIFVSLLFSFAVAPLHAVVTYQAVRASTATVNTPTLQVGAFNISSGTVQNFTANASSETFLNVSQSSITNITAQNFTAVQSTSTSFNASVSSITTIVSQNFTVNQGTATSFNTTVSSITTLTVQNFTVNQSTATSFDFTFSSGTTLIVSSATPAHIIGTTTNDNATAGTYGERISSTTVGLSNFTTTSGNFASPTSVILTAGDWDVTCSAMVDIGGATNISRLQSCINTTANSSTGCNFGDNEFEIVSTSAGTLQDISIAIPMVRESISGTTTIYCNSAIVFTGAVPQLAQRLTARRVR